MDHLLRATDVAGKSVLVRLDLDLSKEKGKFDLTRLEDGLATLRHLLDHNVRQITVIAHMGRPEGKKVASLSLKPIEKIILKKLSIPKTVKFSVLENLRFDKREEAGSMPFARELAKGHDLFVNDAFASSHREHTSITFIPKILPSVFGIQFEIELRGLDPAMNQPKRPFLVILGGTKLETKLPLIEKLTNRVDIICVGGKLAAELVARPNESRKLIIAKMTTDGLDIGKDSIDQFGRFIAMAQTIVWNGPMGKFENPHHRSGTRAIAKMLASRHAYTIAGGGDTEAALSLMKVEKGLSFISSGGGALLEYVAYGTLPGIEAVKASK